MWRVHGVSFLTRALAGVIGVAVAASLSVVHAPGAAQASTHGAGVAAFAEPIGLAKIGGTVSLPAGVAASGQTRVLLYAAADAATPIATVTADSQGDYLFSDLASGEYKLAFLSEGRAVFDRFWGAGATDFGTAETLTLADGESRVDLNLTLARSAAVSGRASAPVSVVLQDGDVTVRVFSSSGTGKTPVRTGIVRSDGGYLVGGLAAGTYRVEFSTAKKGIVSEWWPNRATFGTADAITLGSGALRSGVNATLESQRIMLAAVPTVSGSHAVGKTLTAKRGTWTSGTTFSYQWYAGGKAISKATSSTLKVTSAMLGRRSRSRSRARSPATARPRRPPRRPRRCSTR
ncbi:hypothetical protein [Microbacterium sp. NIBRBAC000506063]|uniref:hypothetical protein n=1 Tax=Microbacterium sp. NIBRBAC000506063 TaxID=2734618 RepID=UPI001BB5E136|nr:hypothetical protein [Microbacterium sp. NIBRBAC000506063]QTV79163.1 hypothetical protein KAE78_08770 [Microbacterium sp. NIBRBAC000506063]